MNGIARLLIGMSLLLLVDGTVTAVHAFPAGRFIGRANLTRAENAAVARLSRFTGRKPWLIFGYRFGDNPRAGKDRTELGVYMQPDAENGKLRRGRVLTMVFAPAKPGQPSTWHIDGVTKYAHVTITGQPADHVNGRWDAAMPFKVPDDLDDAAIVSLVEFIRTRPERPEMPKNLAPQKVDGSMAITGIHRTATGVQVNLQNKPWEGRHVLVEQRQGRWTILEVGFWIA